MTSGSQDGNAGPRDERAGDDPEHGNREPTDDATDDGAPSGDDGAADDGRSPFESLTVGETHETAARTVTEADIVNFAGVSGDFNDLHLDAERMADSEYGERIAQGALIFSIATGLIWQAGVVEGLVAFYGVDRLRFRAPVFVGDTIHVELELVETERRDHPRGSGIARHEAEVVKSDGEVVLSCELLGLIE